MARILYLSTTITRPTGGVRTIFRHVEALRDMGLDAWAVVPEDTPRHPPWFTSAAPVLAGRAALALARDDVVVVPEVMAEMVPVLSRLPQRKVLFCQNQHSMFVGLGGAFRSWAEAGIRDALFCSRYVAERALGCFQFRRAAVVRCVVEGFAPGPKRPAVALMPRKRRDDVPVIRKVFEHRWPRYAAHPWVALDGADEAEVRRVFAESAVFLSLGRQESLGLPPLEAMAAGCLVAGFTGLGGQEYATPDNGLWVAEDDVFAAADAVGRALRRHLEQPEQAAAMRAAGAATAAHYSRDGLREDLRGFYDASGIDRGLIPVRP